MKNHPVVIATPKATKLPTINDDVRELFTSFGVDGAVVVEAIVLVVEDALSLNGTLDVVTTDCESTGTVVEDDVEEVDDGGVVVDDEEEVVVACGCTATVVVGAADVVVTETVVVVVVVAVVVVVVVVVVIVVVVVNGGASTTEAKPSAGRVGSYINGSYPTHVPFAIKNTLPLAS